MAVTNGWGKGAQNSTNGWGKSGTNNIGYGAIYESSAAGDTALIGTSAAFLYSKSSFNQGEADPTPTITGTAGGSFNADAGVVFVDTGTYNSSTGQIDLSATSIGSHIITYTVNGVQSGQTVGVTAVPYASTSSFTFDGVNDYFDAGNPTFFENLSSFSFSCWFNSDVKSNDDGILGKWLSGTDRSFALNLETSGNIRFIVFNSGGTAAQSYINTSDWSTGNWYNVIGTYDGSNIKIYLNAVLKDTVALTGTVRNATQSFRIGVYGSASYFDGNIDEVSIWNTALSQSAVTEIYNSGAPNDLTTLTNASNTNLKAWYKF